MINIKEHPLAGNHDIDSAFSGTWSFYKKWFVTLYSISFVMALVVNLMSGNVDLSALQNTTDLAEIMNMMKSMMGVYSLVMLVSLFFNTLLQYYIIYKPIDENFNLFEAAGKVLMKYYLPLLLIFILLLVFSVIALMLGALLLFIGMFFALPYIMIFFAITTPVMMIENRSIGETITRIIQLAHKKFWPNMGWISVYLLLIIFFSFIVSALIMLPFSGSLFKSFSDPEAASELMNISKSPIFILLTSLTGAITTPFLPILGLIMYFNNSSESDASINRPGSDGNDGKVKVEDLYTKSNKDDFRPSVDDLSP